MPLDAITLPYRSITQRSLRARKTPGTPLDGYPNEPLPDYPRVPRHASTAPPKRRPEPHSRLYYRSRQDIYIASRTPDGLNC